MSLCSVRKLSRSTALSPFQSPCSQLSNTERIEETLSSRTSLEIESFHAFLSMYTFSNSPSAESVDLTRFMNSFIAAFGM